MSWITEKHYEFVDEHQVVFINYPDWKIEDVDIMLGLIRPRVEKVMLLNCGIGMRFIDKILSKIIEIRSVRELDLSYNNLTYSRTYGQFLSPFLKDYINRMNLTKLKLNGCSLSREQIIDVLKSNCLDIEINWNEMTQIEVLQAKERLQLEDTALILAGMGNIIK